MHIRRAMLRIMVMVSLLALVLAPMASGNATTTLPASQSLADWAQPAMCPTYYCNACAVLAFAACKAAGSSVHDIDCRPTTMGTDAMCACVFTCNPTNGINRFLLPMELPATQGAHS